MVKTSHIYKLYKSMQPFMAFLLILLQSLIQLQPSLINTKSDGYQAWLDLKNLVSKNWF
jgi:hypothetical protein